MFRREEQALRKREASEIESLRRIDTTNGEELMLPYGFLGDSG
jgi:hypothetical protein